MPLDPTAATPRYVQLADLLAEQIEAGVHHPGDRLPSLRRLRDQHDVSLTTAVEAVRVLAARGLVESRDRSGTFVTPAARPAAAEPVTSRPSLRARHVDAPLSLRLNLGIGNPQRPTLGAAVQGPELMAIAALNRHLGQAFRLRPDECHAYDAPPGSPELRRAIARRGVDAGYSVEPDEVVVTSGAKEAVYLSIRAVTRPGDTVAIESPAYYALLEVLASLQLRVVEVPSHPATGIDLGALQRVLDRGSISALALVSNYSNPSGSSMDDDAKRALVELLDQHQVPLVEDDVYGDLAFDGVRPKAIKAFDTTGRVLYCGSYSKSLSPGLRVGWALPGRYQHQVEHLKLVVNQATATAPQLALAALLEGGGLDRHLRRIRRAYRDQMAAVTDAVVAAFPEGTRHTSPRGGHVLWVQVPGLDALALHEAAAEHDVHVAPGPMFSARGGYPDFVRLNTGFAWTEATERQVALLGDLVAHQLAGRNPAG